jgi:hypothetical protein
MRHAAPGATRITRFLFAIAILIAAATVYGRYHYATDATAGLLTAMSVFAVVRGRRTERLAVSGDMTDFQVDSNLA